MVVTYLRDEHATRETFSPVCVKVGPRPSRLTSGARVRTFRSGCTVRPASFHDARDHVAVEGRLSGAYNATGKSANLQICHVWSLRDGRVTKYQQ
jgi:ketosteroid isomerase-like protein